MIPPVRPGGWVVLDTPRATELAQIDQNVATRGVDAYGGDTITGTISVQQDPAHLGVTPSLTTSGGTGIIEATAPGATIQTLTGGRFVLGDNDYPIYSANRSRTVLISIGEMQRKHDAGSWNADAGSGGVTENAFNTAGTFFLPIPKPHDGATVSAVTLYFFLAALPAALPGSLPSLLLTETPLTAPGSSVVVASGTFAAASAAAYYNGGGVNALVATVTPTAMNITTAPQWWYLTVIDDNGVAGSRPIYTGLQVQYTSIADERFPQ